MFLLSWIRKKLGAGLPAYCHMALGGTPAPAPAPAPSPAPEMLSTKT